MSKIAIITGITGQDGSYLAELLLKKKYKVHGIIRKNLKIKDSSRYWRLNKIMRDIKLHKVDINSFNKLKNLIKKIRPDEVYHLAASAYGSTRNP